MGMTIDKAILRVEHSSMSVDDKETADFIISAMRKYQKIEQDPTTKNDLGVDCISREDALMCLTGKFEKREYEPSELIKMFARRIKTLPSITPQFSCALDKNSQKLEKDFGELDCISRAQAQTEIEMNASRYTIAKERGGMGQVEWSDQLIKVSDAVDIIRNMSPVTLQEPRWIPVSERLPKPFEFVNPKWDKKEQIYETD